MIPRKVRKLLAFLARAAQEAARRRRRPRAEQRAEYHRAYCRLRTRYLRAGR
jgi:hypothetical protein